MNTNITSKYTSLVRAMESNQKPTTWQSVGVTLELSLLYCTNSNAVFYLLVISYML